MVELVVFFHELVAVVGHGGGLVFGAGLTHHGGEVGNVLHDFFFLHGQPDRRRELLGQPDSGIGGLAQDGTDAGIGVLDEGTCIAVEVDTFLGVEEHVLARVDLEKEIFQSPHAHDACHFGFFFLSHVVELAGLFHCLAGLGYHAGNEVVGINHGTLAALHLAVRQLDHAVGEVDQALAPLEAELVEQDREHLEVVVLLVAYDVNHFVNGEVAETELGGADVLRHVNGSAVGTEQELLVKSLGGEVGPDGTVFLAEKDAFPQTFFDLFLAFQVGIALVVNLVEADTECLVGFVEAGVNPLVHLAPKGTHFGVALLPLHEHGVGFLHERTFFLGLLLGSFGLHAFGLETCFELCHFGAVVLVEGYVVVAYQVVTLLARGLGRFAVAVFQPGQHRFTDVDAPVVHDVGLDHAVAVGFNHTGQCPAQKVVAHVPQVEGLVGVGRGVLYHDERTALGGSDDAETGVGVDFFQKVDPAGGSYDEIEEAAHGIVGGYEPGVGLYPFANLGSGVLRLLLGNAEERKNDEGEMSLKIFLGLLQRYLTGGDFVPVKGLHSGGCGGSELLFYFHYA